MSEPALKTRIKQPAKKKRTRDGHKQCYSYLGEVGALAFYTYLALRHEISLSELVVWTNRLQQAIVAIPEKYRPKQDAQLEDCDLVMKRAISRPQVSLWKKSAPMQAEASTVSVDVRAASFRIDGIDKDDRVVWSGHLLFVFDARTNTLVHHFAAYNVASRQLSTEALLYALSKALDRIQILRGEGDAERVRQIEFNGLGVEKAAYQEVFLRLSGIGPIRVRWQGQQIENSQLDNLLAIGTDAETLSVQTYYPNSQAFKSALVRIVDEFDKLHATSSEKMPCRWQTPNTVKASEKKNPRRFDRV